VVREVHSGWQFDFDTFQEHLQRLTFRAALVGCGEEKRFVIEVSSVQTVDELRMPRFIIVAGQRGVHRSESAQVERDRQGFQPRQPDRTPFASGIDMVREIFQRALVGVLLGSARGNGILETSTQTDDRA
jgi:hypothetical protein